MIRAEFSFIRLFVRTFRDSHEPWSVSVDCEHHRDRALADLSELRFSIKSKFNRNDTKFHLHTKHGIEIWEIAKRNETESETDSD